MKLALAQMQMSSAVEKNYQKTLGQLETAATREADLVLFPEIQLTPFFPQYPGSTVEDYVLTLDSPYVAGIREACKTFGIWASPNFYVEENGHHYDMSLLVDRKGTIVGTQKMVHIAEAEQFFEQSYYTPSDEGFQVFSTEFGTIGIVVCFDRHYPESIRTEALKGAELVLVPTANTKAEPSELFQWEMKVQAFQNSVNVAMCNRTGREGDMDFSGESLVADFEGNTVALAGAGEELLFAEVDLPSASKTRSTKPYTSLRRPEWYC